MKIKVSPQAILDLAAAIRSARVGDTDVSVEIRDSEVDGKPALLADVKWYHQRDGEGTDTYLLGSRAVRIG